MIKPKLIDVVLFVALLYGTYDCLKNWKVY